MDILVLLSLGVVTVVSGAAGYLEFRRVARIAVLVSHLAQTKPLYLSERWVDIRYLWDSPEDDSQRWQRCILVMTHKRIAVYAYLPPPDKNKLPEPLLTIPVDALRGFWRPEKYTAGVNEMWIHAEHAQTWRILKLRTRKYEMEKLVRAMKVISTPEQVKAYRRRRPYPNLLTDSAYPAKQALTGVWELGKPVSLYIMPLMLVVLHQNRVLETITLAAIQDIAALKRMEGGEPEGLVRFTIVYDNGDSENTYAEKRAFALQHYENWATVLAEAAKRTLEEPIQRKRKGKDDDDDADDDDDDV